ncbi:sigma-54 interaction domain-containing protein [Neobacillus rhizophilus]|uniref:HTH-type transcriptional regulatory protein TyrR n=1 Tax=Neobacillus rhizophilus TaxID=2833579 RepID=A0A942YXJ3_9BACI|nr:sigma 54-interacting transcriptional regulator [Neobacillus rhizophilus]MBS4215160.1 sigma 54-interacting transcriptional regulator [Neobacillus rhizophilus]
MIYSSENLFRKFLDKGKDDSKTYEELKQLYSILESIIESSYDAICVNDSNAMGVIANEAYTRMTGVRREELIGKSLPQLIDEGTISDSVTLKVLKEKRVKTIIQNIRGKELLVTGSPVYDENGKITHVVSNLRDISDLNKLKSELYESRVLTKKYLNEIKELKQKEGARLMMDGIIAQSKEIIKVLHLTKKVANVDSAVLLNGESGVGKEVFANMIHINSKRVNKPYVKVNCGAIPEQLLESELFGYEKGAFTGADIKGKPGYFEQAHGGTIFLDEIGEMPLELQVKLLRVLQEYEIMRVGGTKTVKVDVRIISATNRNLQELVEKGQFRKDLFYRLNIVPIEIPALRSRRADIPPLTYYFLNNMNEKYKMNIRIQPEVIRCFEEYHWPGNIREMENLIERLVVTSDGEEITVNHLPEDFFSKDSPTKEWSLKELVEELERKVIKETMKEYRTTRKAANKLGISQPALVKKMQKLKINEY